MRALLYMLFLCLFILSLQAHASDPRVVQKNNSAVKKLSPESTREAYREVLEALKIDPLNPILRQNLGLVFLASKEEQKALKEFKFAEELAKNNPDLKFETLFNQGVVQGQLGQIDNALSAYQAALEINPESLEVKKNIELLLSSQGQGQGENKENQGQDQSQEQNPENEQGQGQQQAEQKGPKPFESKELTKEDVRRILEELKSQEQKIRAELLSKGAKEKPDGKDW